MLNSYYTEKLLGLQMIEIKNITKIEEKYEITIEQPRKVCVSLLRRRRDLKRLSLPLVEIVG